MAYINLSAKCQEILRLTFTKTQHLKPVITDAAANIAAAHWHTNTVWANLADEMRQVILACLGAVAPVFQAHLFFSVQACNYRRWLPASESRHSPRQHDLVAGVGGNKVQIL